MLKALIRRLFLGKEFIISLMLLWGYFYVQGQDQSKPDSEFDILSPRSGNESSIPAYNFRSGMAQFDYIPVYDRNPSDYNIFTVFTRSTFSTLYIFAPNGEPIYYKIINDYGYDFKLLPDNTLSYFDQERVGYVIMDEYFNEIDFIEAKNGLETDFHELFYHDNAYFLLAKDTREIDMSSIVDGGKEDAKVIGIVIQKIDKEKNLLFEWNSFDHFEIKDSYGKLSVEVVDPFHINSIELDTDSTILISSRNLNEITKINLNNGEIIWRMGGENNEFEFIGFDRPFAGQHTLKRREGKLYTLFDNGLQLEPEYSRGLIIEINEEQKQVKLIKEFRHSPDIYSRIVGNVQNLKNGNFLIYWGINTGLDIDGSFTVYNDKYEIIEKGKLINTLAYRVFKFDWRPQNFSSDQEEIVFQDTREADTSRTILNVFNNSQDTIVIDEFVWSSESFSIGPGPIILPPMESNGIPVRFTPKSTGNIEDILTLRSNGKKEGYGIQVLLKGRGVKETGIANNNSPEVKLYPMPFNDKLHFEAPGKLEKFQLTYLSGQIILEGTIPENNRTINTSSLKNGVYILFLQFEGGKTYRKIVIKE